MKEAVAVVDTGTTSVRVVLFDGDGARLAAFQRANPPEYLAGGLVEQGAESWPTAMFQLLAEASAAATERGLSVAAVSLTSQRSSVIPVDGAGKPLAKAIMWQDRRTDELCREYAAELPELYRKTGIRLTSVFSAPKMRWLRDNRPQVYRKSAKLIGVHDLLLHTLTGRFVTDHSLAGRTNLLNVTTLDWDPELLELFAVERRRLCDLVPPGSIVGELLPGAATRSGLPPGTPVVTAGGDQQCAALGMGLYEPGRIVTNTGTGSYALGCSETPKFHDGMGLFCNPAAVPGGYTVEATIPTTGSVYRWLAELLFRGDAEPIRRLNEAAVQAPPGSNGVHLVPHFQGSGSPEWIPGASGSITGLSLGSSPGDLGRAVLEGIARELRRNVELIRDLAGSVAEIRSAGGMTEFPLFNQILADHLDLPVYKLTDPESTARGAWIAAAVALGDRESYGGAVEQLEGAEEKGSSAGTERYEPVPETVRFYRAG